MVSFDLLGYFNSPYDPFTEVNCVWGEGQTGGLVGLDYLLLLMICFGKSTVGDLMGLGGLVGFDLLGLIHFPFV